VGSAAGLSLLGCLPFHVPLHNRDNWDMMIWAGFPFGHPCVVQGVVFLLGQYVCLIGGSCYGLEFLVCVFLVTSLF
jgi:hypothetical protein